MRPVLTPLAFRMQENTLMARAVEGVRGEDLP